VLIMTIRTLGGMGVEKALNDLAPTRSSKLRDLIRKAAKRGLGSHPAFNELVALLDQCKAATRRRNDLTHDPWAMEPDGEMIVRTKEHKSVPLPTVPQLEELARDLVQLTDELNSARMEGFLAQALKAAAP
jgi:hypothetical protein